MHSRDWCLQPGDQVWRLFNRPFRALWNDRHAGDAFAPGLVAEGAGPAALKGAQDAYMRRLFGESLGFAGCKMTRRILGLAHVEDLESIANPHLRAECEKRALNLARAFLVEGQGFADIRLASGAARACRRDTVK